MPKTPTSLKGIEQIIPRNQLEQLIPIAKSFDGIGKNLIGEDGFSILQSVSNGLASGLMSGDLLDGIVGQMAISNENRFAMKLKDSYPKIKDKFSELLDTEDSYSKEIIAAFNPKFPEDKIREVLADLFKYLQRDEVKRKFAKKQQDRLNQNANASLDPTSTTNDINRGGNRRCRKYKDSRGINIGGTSDIEPCSNCSDAPITLESSTEPSKENEHPEDKLLDEFTLYAYNRYCCKLNNETEINDIITYYEKYMVDIFALKINDLLKHDMEAIIDFTTNTFSGDTGGGDTGGDMKSMLKNSAQAVINNPNLKNIGSNIVSNIGSNIEQKLKPNKENIGELINQVKNNPQLSKMVTGIRTGAETGTGSGNSEIGLGPNQTDTNISSQPTDINQNTSSNIAVPDLTNGLGNQLKEYYNTGKPITQQNIDTMVNNATTTAISTIENFITNNKSKITNTSKSQMDVVKNDIRQVISSFVGNFFTDKYKTVLQGLLNGEITKTSKRLTDKLHSITYTIFDDYYPHAMIDALLVQYCIDILTSGEQAVEKSNISNEERSPDYPISGGLSENLEELEKQAEVIEYILRDINTTFCKKIIKNLENTAYKYNSFVTYKLNEIMKDAFNNRIVTGGSGGTVGAVDKRRPGNARTTNKKKAKQNMKKKTTRKKQ